MESAVLGVHAKCCVFKGEFGLILLAEVKKGFSQQETFQLVRSSVATWEVKGDKE